MKKSNNSKRMRLESTYDENLLDCINSNVWHCEGTSLMNTTTTTYVYNISVYTIFSPLYTHNK